MSSPDHEMLYSNHYQHVHSNDLITDELKDSIDILRGYAYNMSHGHRAVVASCPRLHTKHRKKSLANGLAYDNGP